MEEVGVTDLQILGPGRISREVLQFHTRAPLVLCLFRSEAVRREPKGKAVKSHTCQAVHISSYLNRMQNENFNNTQRNNKLISHIRQIIKSKVLGDSPLVSQFL